MWILALVYLVAVCHSNPCEHGHCLEIVDEEKFKCECQAGYTGELCGTGNFLFQFIGCRLDREISAM